MSADELPGWRETTAKQSIVEFVDAVTYRGISDAFGARDRSGRGLRQRRDPLDRETRTCQLAFAVDRAVVGWVSRPRRTSSVPVGCLGWSSKASATTHGSSTTDEFHPRVVPLGSPRRVIRDSTGRTRRRCTNPCSSCSRCLDKHWVQLLDLLRRRRRLHA